MREVAGGLHDVLACRQQTRTMEQGQCQKYVFDKGVKFIHKIRVVSLPTTPTLRRPALNIVVLLVELMNIHTHSGKLAGGGPMGLVLVPQRSDSGCCWLPSY